MRCEELKEYCFNKLQAIESILNEGDSTTSFDFAPNLKLRLTTKVNILKHLINYETCLNFASVEELSNYIEDRTDIILGFYED